MPDAVVVGAGPNGLAGAIELARAGLDVRVREANPEVGGATRSMELTLPGFVHDFGSAIHPLGIGSPYLSRLPLEEHGLRWVHPPAPVVHALDAARPAVLERSVEATAAGLGAGGAFYRSVVEDLAEEWSRLAPDVLAPLRIPRHPLLYTRFGMRAVRSAATLIGGRPRGDPAAALLAGSAAHAGLPLESPATAAFALVLHAAAHAVGWPFPAGGAGALTRAMAAHLERLGGTIETGAPVRSLDELVPARIVLLDLTPRQVLAVAGDRLPAHYRSALARFRYGAGVYKMDWALAEPIPWQAPDCRRAATVHLGGPAREVAAAMRAVARGGSADEPFVILAQPSLFDPGRAPPGKHTAWAYCHVPNGSTREAAEAIETRIERFAPGFRDTILARSVLSPRRLEEMDANLVGGDVNGGAPDLRQLFFRPALRRDPYRTPLPGLFLCSASTPPGGGVHGMCGFHAARSALRWLGVPPAPLPLPGTTAPLP